MEKVPLTIEPFFCTTRNGVRVNFNHYCDLFDKRKPHLLKRCCKNCKYFSQKNEKQETQDKTQDSPPETK